ncbi:MAG: ATP-grasp domain-containing protein [Desulfobacterota bacterium]|nr:ATP-grasp domain-containing protein [Thermodesulfobacteriota bacterium]
MVKNHTACNILFTSIGRRVALIRHFQQTLKALGVQGKVIGVDITRDAPAFHVVDKAFSICRIDDPRYIDTLLDICAQENVALLIPLIDTDLLLLAYNRDRFADIGANAVISDPLVVERALNKYKTHDFFVSHGIDTPRIFDIHAALASEAQQYPLFMKPHDGNASKGIVKIRSRNELAFFKDYVPRPLLQEYVEGTEYTLDIFYDFACTPRCVVPRKRIEVRSGEVSKAVIEKHPAVLAQGWRVAESLEGCRGCINVQCFLTADGAVRFVEINPRFGGGAPLSIHAGADFPRWLVQLSYGEDPGDVRNCYREHVYMLRYDDAVFVEGTL